jgi:hypothetical protein
MSLKTGRGSSVMVSGRSLVLVWQARLGRPLMTMAQAPQMPARQQKSKMERRVLLLAQMRFSAMNRVMLVVSSSTKVCMCGVDSLSSGL